MVVLVEEEKAMGARVCLLAFAWRGQGDEALVASRNAEYGGRGGFLLQLRLG
jgi:hypothetical protein